MDLSPCRTLVRCFVSERLQWKEQLRLDHLVVGAGAPHRHRSRLLARIVVGDRIFLFGLMPYGSLRGVFTGPAQSDFDVLHAQLFCGIQR